MTQSRGDLVTLRTVPAILPNLRDAAPARGDS